MKERNSNRIGVVFTVIVLIISVLTVAVAISESNNEDNSSVLVYKRGITTEELLRSDEYSVLADYDEFVLVSASEKNINSLLDQDFTVDTLEDREKVAVHSHTFNSSEGIPEVSDDLIIDRYPEGVKRAYLVQFIGPIAREWVEELNDQGVITHEYRQRYNLLVEMDTETAQRVEGLDFVNWVEIYQPAFKFDHDLLDISGTVDLEVYTFDTADTRSIASRISSFAQVYHVKNGRIITQVDSDDVGRIANMHGVRTFNHGFFEYQLYNDDATWVTQSGVEDSRRLTEEGVVGDGQIVTVMDSELYTDHEMFADPDGNPIGSNHRKILDMYVPDGARGDIGEGVYHGTHVSGTVLGDAPVHDTYDKHDGHAMGSRLIFQDVGDASGNLQVPDEMYDSSFSESHSAGSRVHTNSWGGRGGYDGYAVETDEFIWDHQDYTVLWAAGNDGPDSDTLSGQAQAKNALSVGAAVNAPRHDEVAEFSSRGWAADGRIKPTLLGVGQGVTSSDQSVDGYTSMSGTSMATPGVAGQVAQVRQYYEDGYYPMGYQNPDDGFNPSNALIKASMINGAVEISNDGAYHNGNQFPNQDQGFGLSTLDRSLYFEWDERKSQVYDSWNEGVELSTGESWSMEFDVVDDSMPLEATLVWSDPPGEANSDPTIVNDLDLELFTPDNTRYVGNAYTGNDPGYSQPDPNSNNWNGGRSGEWDGLNVEENILLLPDHNGVGTGTYELKVSGHNVPQDSQPFAVVVSGGLEPIMPDGDSPDITLSSPTGGESWNEGTEQQISWNTGQGDDPIDAVDLRYTIDNGETWNDLAMDLPGSETSYTWTLPNYDSSVCMIRARITDTSGRFAYDTSGHFTIVGTPPGPPSDLGVVHDGGPTLVSFDDFSDGHDDWTEHSGEWNSSSGYLQGHGAISTPSEWDDEDIGAYGEWEFDFQLASTEEVSDTYQLLRFDFINMGDPDNPTGYYVIVTGDVPGGSQANLWRIEDGESPDDAPLIAGMWSADTDVHTLGIERLENNDIILYMDGEELGSTNDDSYTSSDYMGFRFDENPADGGDHMVHEVRAQKILEDNEHNHVSWDASADEAIDEVDHYNVYRAEESGGPFEKIGSVEADGSEQYTHVDFYKGDADDEIWWYNVRAVGTNGLEESNTEINPEPGTELETFQMPLSTDPEADDWNFVSFNLIPGDSSLESILEDPENGISGSYEKVIYYDSGSGEWKSYIPGRSDHFNGLNSWDHTMGLWIRMTEDETLMVEGTEPTSTDMTLNPGWNMVSYPSSTATFGGTPEDVTIVGRFDASQNNNLAYDYDPDNFEFEPGEGYYLYNDADEDVIWTVDY